MRGRIDGGETIRVVSSANPGRTFPVTVATFDPPRSMTWRGGLPLGLFIGICTCGLTPTNGGSTRFDLREEYSGPLLGLMRQSMPDLEPSAPRRSATALKRHADMPLG